MSLAIPHKTVLVTGANRGLGRALVDEALRRGAKRVYAASRLMSQMLAAGWRAGVAKQLERQNAALVAADPIAA